MIAFEDIKSSEFQRFDTLDAHFEQLFSRFEEDFFKILSKAYPNYYGKDYHKKRIKQGQSIIYLGFINKKLVAVSYVKRNLRRGGTAVYPLKFRRLGLAEKLVKLSLEDFPFQYTILSTQLSHSHKMLSLMEKLGFRPARTTEEIKNIVGDEFYLLSNFRFEDQLVFDRVSEKRDTKRDRLVLIHNLNLT